MSQAQPYTVTLDIRNFAQTDPTWKDVTASNGQTYSYKYGGGSDGRGNVTEKGRGAVDITVELICDARYQISAVTFGNDPNHQLSCPSSSARSATIHDVNDAVESKAYYAITIQDTSANCTLVCDPYISNIP